MRDSKIAPVNQDSITDWLKTPAAQQGKIYIQGEISLAMAEQVCQKIASLDSEPSVGRITIYLNTQGGIEQSYMAIVNTMWEAEKAVDTVNLGYCFSAGCAIHQAATGRRLAFPNSLFGLHAPKANGRAFRKYFEPLAKQRYTQLITKRSNLPEDWLPLTEQLVVFDARRALEIQFIDEIVEFD